MLRSPRSLIKLAGTAFAPLSWEVDSNSFYQADTFRCELPIANTPGLSWFGDQTDIPVEILVGLPPDPNRWNSGDLSSLFSGKVDDVDIDIAGRTVSLTGRDLTGALIDFKSSEKYPNKTASEIATIIAGRHGLTPVVKDTETIVGRHYNDDKGVRLQDENTEWDLLTWLAREENLVCYVQGNELHFEPAPDETKPAVTFTYTPPQDGPLALSAARIKLSRSLTLAKDITVEVSSWPSNGKKVVRQTATRQTKGTNAGALQKYSYSIPNLTVDKTKLQAEKILADLTIHEFKINIEGPADYPATIGKTDLIKLTGSDSAWDTLYHPATVNRSFRDTGYTWSIEAKNHGVEGDPTL